LLFFKFKFFLLKALQVFRTLKSSDQTTSDNFQVNDQKPNLSDTFKRNIEEQDRSEYFSDYENNETKK
jgi:hypothetical protein